MDFAQDPRARSSRERYAMRRTARAQGILRRTFRSIVHDGGRIMHWIGAELWSRHYASRLASLDDRMLADIGIARHEIHALVREAWRDRRIRNER